MSNNCHIDSAAIIDATQLISHKLVDYVNTTEARLEKVNKFQQAKVGQSGQLFKDKTPDLKRVIKALRKASKDLNDSIPRDFMYSSTHPSPITRIK